MPDHGPRAARPSTRTLTLAAVALLLVDIVTLAAGFGQRDGFILVEGGRPRWNEFIGVRAAGDLALAGQAAKAYDWDAHLARQREMTGSTANLNFPWSYPPPYMLIAVAIASLPVVAGALTWLLLTLGFYLWVIRRASGLPLAALWAAATPATFVNAMVIHTGFASSGLLGLAVVSLTRRPLMSGVCFGLLTMKPQLGLLVPIALVAGRHWRVIGSAAATAAALIVASLLCFGIEPWLALPSQMARVTQTVREGRVSFETLVTLYGALRLAGISSGAASVVQAMLTVTSAAVVFRLWRSDAGLDLKAAGLALASLLATPYLFAYDLTMLAVVAAFLVHAAGEDGLQRAEIATLGLSSALLFAIGWPVPVGFIATLLTGAVVARRAWPYVGFGRARAVGAPFKAA